jgi:hypothetical protein
MSDTFNGYHVWLGIPPSEQPTNHYRLLGITLFETDLDVIDHAADRQMAHVRTFQAGRHGALSQQILNELASARLCLLDPQRKAAYDQQLRSKIPSSVTVAAVPQGKALPVAQPVGKAVPRATPMVGKPAGAAAAVSSYEPVDEIELNMAALAEELPNSASTLQATRRRRSSSEPDWGSAAALGTVAAIIVMCFMLTYYFGGRVVESIKQRLTTAPPSSTAGSQSSVESPPAGPSAAPPPTPEASP